MSVWLKGLNPEQQQAVLHVEGPLLILAGAGSGKTTVLVSRTGYLLESGAARAREMVVLTFTNKAARELQTRVQQRLGKMAQGLWAGTFHSFGLQVLRAYHKEADLPKFFGILDASDTTSIVKEILKDVRHGGKDAFKVEKLLSIMSDWRARGQTEAKNEDEYEEMVEMILPKYQKKLRMLGAVDFDALLIEPMRLFRSRPEILEAVQSGLRFLMVDEFQDTNHSQFELVRTLIRHNQNIAVVGDDDQSIYGWRGALVSNILHFPRNFKGCETIRLERNYRSTPAILSVANAVIQNNTERHSKQLKSDPHAERGALPEAFQYATEEDEAESVIQHIRHFERMGFQPRDMVILYRSNGQAGPVEALLRESRIPYTITGGSSLFDRKESKDLISFLRCAYSPTELSFRRILNTPPRGIGDVTIETIQEYSQKKGKPFWQASRRWREMEVPQRAGLALDDIWNYLEQLRERIDSTSPDGLEMVLISWLKEIGYDRYLRGLSKDEQGFQNRWITVEIFARVMAAFLRRDSNGKAPVLDFIDKMELREVYQTSQKEDQGLQLMTLHACKGLEFPVVILIGVEEDLIPHRVLGTDVAEERRLFYVGVTRAQKHLVLTRAQQRRRHGQYRPTAPSRFLLEIPADLIKTYEGGHRPVSAAQKQNLMADLMAKLEKQIEKQKIEK